MRVVSLVPAATEIVAALGAAQRLVAISHECDYPPSLGGLPRVTTTPIDASASSGAIDAQVRAVRAEGRPVIAMEAETLRRLAPDVILTQALCDVCAVADGEAHRLATVLNPEPRVLSLGATTLAGIEDDVRAVASALECASEADRLIAELRRRLDQVRRRRAASRPRVVCIEWLDPLYLAGHWVPELVEAAGGQDVGAAPGSHSARRTWTEVAGLRPEIAFIMLCGFRVERARQEIDGLDFAEAIAALGNAPVWLLDANAYTSRPGPRVVEGAELLQAALHGRELPGLERWH